MRNSKYALVLVTAPDLKTARRLAQRILKPRLAACVNLVGGIESHYWWKGKLEKGRETLLVIKTTSVALNELEKLILREHPYDTPEFIALPIQRGNKRYLDWLSDSVEAP
ncbi:MAG TPA: divalent-cation tolerance protein CutA [Verrucomicrobiae bacterium]|nr:divalent-cation tolerance protein CutA [Verrucomicrobiae bacterium]